MSELSDRNTLPKPCGLLFRFRDRLAPSAGMRGSFGLFVGSWARFMRWCLMCRPGPRGYFAGAYFLAVRALRNSQLRGGVHCVRKNIHLDSRPLR
jgi:hypothetical protein